MLRLHAFGTATLLANGALVTGASAQQRRLALLTVIAAAGERGISRDTLLGLLWPDSSTEKARHALSQWLFLIRRDLGVEDLFVGSATLQLNPTRISSDVGDFDRAVVERDDATVARVYHGPFLHGFFLSDAPEFEPWMERERGARHREVLRAVERLARDSERSDVRASVHWWQRLAALDPHGGVAAANLIRVLTQSGDQVGALAFARRHEALLRTDLGLAPSPEVATLVAQLRAQTKARAVASADDPAVLTDPYLSFLRDRLGELYTIDRLVARTSICSVFDARTTAEHRSVTLKVFLPDLVARADHVRLAAGVRATSTLVHPHIERPLDVGVRDGIVFVAFGGGATRNLRDHLEEHDHVSLAVVISTALAISDGLACAHESRVIHADLTPRRICVRADDTQLRISIADLGFLGAVTAASARSAHDSGLALGTPAYMSPEQLIGTAEPDAASDVYSLGCIVYHLLTGRPPHAGASARAIITARLREPAEPVRVERDDVPPALASLITRMLERDPAARPTARVVRDALAPMLRSE